MDRHVNYVLAGGFVVTVLCIMLGFIFWLVGTHDARSYDRYTLKFHGAVGGVSVGGTVSYRGVEVGNVLDVRFTKDEPDIIRVDIEVDQDTPVNTGTKAALKPQGITGLAFIELSTEKMSDATIEKQEGERYPVIQASGSALNKILSDFPQITERAIELIGRLNTLLSDENIGHISGSFENIESLTVDLNGLLNDENVANVSTTLDNAVIVSEDAKTLVAAMKQASESLSATTQRLDKILKKNEKPIEHFTGEGLNDVSLLVNESRDMVKSIKHLADKISEDPSRVIYQPKYKGVKISP